MQKYAEHWAEQTIPKTYKDEKKGNCHYIERELLDSLLNLCWSGEPHLPGSGSE